MPSSYVQSPWYQALIANHLHTARLQAFGEAFHFTRQCVQHNVLLRNPYKFCNETKMFSFESKQLWCQIKDPHGNLGALPTQKWPTTYWKELLEYLKLRDLTYQCLALSEMHLLLTPESTISLILCQKQWLLLDQFELLWTWSIPKVTNQSSGPKNPKTWPNMMSMGCLDPLDQGCWFRTPFNLNSSQNKVPY